MELTEKLIMQEFTIHDVILDDLKVYIDVKKECYKKYVDEYYGGWIDQVQIDLNTKAFKELMKQTCFKKILLNNLPVGFFAYDVKKDKINGISIQMIQSAQNKGMGSSYLNYIISVSKKMKKPIFLKVFKSNPAQFLYVSFGFEIYDKSRTHYFMRLNH